MSDTPRTDALVSELDRFHPGVQADELEALCREIERELAAAKLALEDKQFCKEGLWFCEVGEKLSGRLELQMNDASEARLQLEEVKRQLKQANLTILALKELRKYGA